MQTNVLIIDNSIFARALVRRSLQAYGIEKANFFEAPNSYEALSVLKNNEVDFIFTDLNRASMDGEWLLKLIKSDSNFSHIPVIIISSLINYARKKRLLSFGATAILQKPITLMAIDNIFTNHQLIAKSFN